MKITDNCAGCQACESTCPKHCISMVADSEGFLSPVIDETKCIECFACTKVCPQNGYERFNEPFVVFAARLKSDEVLSSASGGVAYALERQVVLNEGIAVGAAYDDSLTVKHIIVDSVDRLGLLQSSKYVQSDIVDTFSSIKTLLKSGKKILFTGTPCQVAGLKAYLRQDYENLTTVDLICHGVPSPRLFRAYISWLENKLHGKILNFDFRSKVNGWGLDYRTRTRTRTRTRSASADPYYRAFCKGETYRESCYQCHYSCSKRVGDITLGDYWGIEEEHPQFMDKRGVSLVLVNTQKGKKMLDSISSQFEMLESTFEAAARHNENLRQPCRRPQVRDTIYHGLDQGNEVNYINKVLIPRIPMTDKLKASIPPGVKKFIKRIIGKL